MNEQQLLTFIEVARRKHFRQAADALQLTQPAVSAQIRSLEEELGTTLFYRPNVKLTSSGSLFLPYALQIVDLIREAKESISENEKKPINRPMVIGTTSCLAMTVLLRLTHYFQSFRQTLPLRVLTLSADEIITALNEGQVDLGIAYKLDSLPSHIQTKTLFYDSFALIASYDHPLAKKNTYITVSDLEHIPIISFAPSTMERRMMDQIFKQYGIQLNIMIELTSVDEIKSLVAANYGAALIPTISVDSKSSSYRRIHMTKFDHSFPVQLYYPEKRYQSRTLRKLIEDISGIYTVEDGLGD
ncbi:LysR family transcriptional regulator [Thermoflavimicrobium dichotomicum]|uniref:LysR family transcriptional regulator, transcription activator of glutamate synthase operon n=1 Tax=Thermoflavimicrobium dichotomicum TaxID=46223 RepID=A0A1I3MN21_9BACL|nr:LysR family transcriptional regulator [Thermoflavimicrobium dichotomicum]SFI98428.1 LysR family transcriptional regulator, transcription activator of glutamate synthase operon [Thermoflavimicrobium dichotomicum]